MIKNKIVIIKINEIDTEALYTLKDGKLIHYGGTTWQALYDLSNRDRGGLSGFYNTVVAPKFAELGIFLSSPP